MRKTSQFCVEQWNLPKSRCAPDEPVSFRPAGATASGVVVTWAGHGGVVLHAAFASRR